MDAGTESVSLAACLDDESAIADRLPDEVDDDWNVAFASTIEDVIDHLEDTRDECVVIGEQAPDASLTAAIETVRGHRPGVPVLAVVNGAETAADALEAGATDVVDAAEPGASLLTARLRNAVADWPSTRRFYEALIEHSSDVVTAIGPGGAVVYQSPSVERHLGHDPGALLGEDTFEYVHPDDRDRVEAAFVDLVEGDERLVEDVEFRFQRGDGSWVWLESVASQQGPSGESGFVVNSRVIQDRKENERELAHAETVFQNVQDGVFLVDVTAARDFEVRRVNPAYESMTGRSSEQLRGKAPHEIVGEEAGERIEAKFRECVQREASLAYDEEFDDPDLPRYMHTRIAPVVVDGEVRSVVGATRDVTTQKEYERALERRFDEFSEVLAEDLREPVDRAISELVAVRRSDGNGSLEEAIRWLRRADSMLEDVSIVHSNSVPDVEPAETPAAGATQEE